MSLKLGELPYRPFKINTECYSWCYILLKSLQGKQASLLYRLDELDQECAGLREELEQVEGSRQKLQEEVKEMQNHCDELKEQLCAEQVIIAHR